MSIQPDTWIKKMCKEHNMIEPFLDHQVSEGKISYGLSSMGYDVRISDEYRIFTNVNNSLVDPKNFSDDNFVKRQDPYSFTAVSELLNKFKENIHLIQGNSNKILPKMDMSNILH